MHKGKDSGQRSDVDVSVCPYAMWIKGVGRRSKKDVERESVWSSTLIICAASHTVFEAEMRYRRRAQAIKPLHTSLIRLLDVTRAATIIKGCERKLHNEPREGDLLDAMDVGDMGSEIRTAL